MAVDRAILRKVDYLKQQAAHRDSEMETIRKIRSGDANLLFPDMFSDKFNHPMAANFIDVAARDLAEVEAPLPALNCASGAMKTNRDKQRAALKNKIGTNYWKASQLEKAMFQAADTYNTYGFIPFYVEPAFDKKTPVITVESALGAYYEMDRFGCVHVYVKVMMKSAAKLAAEYPDYADEILNDEHGRPNYESEIELVRYCDDGQIILYLPSRNIVLAQSKNILGRCPVAIAERPKTSSDDTARGQFDDVVWVWLARDLMVRYGLSAAEQSVNAPTALPRDATKLDIGPRAIIRTDSPEKVRRVQLDVPQSAFLLDQQLDQELRTGTRYPDARSGTVNASVVTGRGIQELMGSFDTQIKAAQIMLGFALTVATELCFELDEKLWPNSTKTINGTANGETYSVTYNPSRDIAGNYACDITYGFAAGLAPQNAVVMLLQLLQADVISMDTFRRQLPWQMDADQEQRAIDVEEAHQALKQAVFSYAQLLGPLAEQGQDASKPLIALAQIVKGRQQGESLEDLVLKAFPPPPPPEEQPGADQSGAPDQGAAGGGPDGQLPPGVQPSGLLQGVAPGQAANGPGGAGSVQQLISNLRSNGTANASVSTSQRVPG